MGGRTGVGEPQTGFRFERFFRLACWSILLPPFGHGQAVVTGAGYSAPRPVEVAPGQVITVFVRIPGKSSPIR